MQTGKIGVTTEDIFPIIKKFLYSDHEIFLRELVSNAVDATQKIRALSSAGEATEELGDVSVRIALDTEKKTLTISDRGLGMSDKEVERYINQIAFSSADEFMKKYHDQAIIGHFGLGFYSAFMVADKVEIRTRSYKEGAETWLWSCDGTPEYSLEKLSEQRGRGTDVILYLSEESAEFADEGRILALLKKYCRFLPVPIAFGKEQEWRDGKMADTDRDRIINDVSPLWTRKPAEVKTEKYDDFYSELYPGSEPPLFSIHLNIDYPFNLTGILYFPKVSNTIELQRNKIQLYSNQVFVTDSVEGIVPDFLMLLHGVIDSPDIPLNVSRSYLQSDSNVKKISSYITRKVADKLAEQFGANREEFERKWDDLKLFIEYGVVSDEKFAEKAADFLLVKNSEGKYFTMSEYRELIAANQTDRERTLIYLYTDDLVSKHSFIEAARARGYDVLVMGGQLDNHFAGWFEHKNEKTRFVRVDSDVVDNLVRRENANGMSLTSQQQEIMRPVFEAQLPKGENETFNVQFEAMAPEDMPVVLTRGEYMRRMKEMAAMGGDGMSRFYVGMPDDYTLTVNVNHPLVINILGGVEHSYGERLNVVSDKIESAAAEERNLGELLAKKKPEEITDDEKKARDEIHARLDKLRGERNKKLGEIGASSDAVRQLIDLALLAGGMLRGEKLTAFVKRSVEMIK
ncbi:MAG: molecular chaperone HtpG [Rikenellaceae bacterium]|jgi:molecular chaperone HtpG|nr:molecular chaperone HtpG [Rikenellaceae bacterium]